MRHTSTRSTLALALASAALFSASAFAQQDNALSPAEETFTVEDQSRDIQFTFGAGYIYSFDTDIQGNGGEFSTSSLSAGLDARKRLSDNLVIDFRINFGVVAYDFDGGGTPTLGGFGGLDPWDDIYNVDFGFALAWEIDDHWSVFGGPIFQFAGENGADWGDSFSGGVIAGATYLVHDRFLIGGGVGVVSQIEDSAHIWPLIIIEWNFSPGWRISSRGPSGGRIGAEFTGVELVWNPLDHWEFALGTSLAHSRFRLDDDGPAPDGVGQIEGNPVWLRTSYRVADQIVLSGLLGMGFGGDIRLEDSSGNRVASADYDSPLFVGFFGSIRF